MGLPKNAKDIMSVY
jgi:hypothetical protein